MARRILLCFLALFALLSLPSADALGAELADFDRALEAYVSLSNDVLVSSPQVITAGILVTNPSESAMPLYLLRQHGKDWEVVRLVGALPPRSKTQLNLEFEVTYQKERERTTRYALVGRGEDGRLYGTYFEVKEDWEPYESQVRNNMTDAIVSVVPILCGVIIALLILIAQTAYTSRSRGLTPGEYTMRTFVFPQIEGRPFEEKVADIIINPIMMAFELACVAVLVFVMLDNVAQSSGMEDGMKIMLLSAIGSFFIPFLYFAAAWYFEKREEGKPLRFFAAMFVWGMFAAFLSLLISSTLIGGMKGADSAPYLLLALMFVAPIVEETMKGLGVLFISGHHEYNDTLTAMLLGFTVGVGFAFVENWFYFSAKSSPFEAGIFGWLVLVAYRSFFNSLAHGCFTAAASIMIGYARSVERLKRFARLAFVPGLFVAIVLHSIFNLSAIADGYMIADTRIPFFIFNPMLIILLAAMFFLVLVVATIDEKRRKIAARHAMASAAGDKSGMA
ncbi:MAG: PrsW family intramembrane metalloprotease [Candidatus Micrarchaeota archaeon]|nr:PrsW family intramembrane metalloprotease [Candidatus Micrarchaeota archaeon]